MSTAQELRAQLESNTLSLNALRSTLADLRRDRDFPHNLRKQAETIELVMAKLRGDLQQAEIARIKIIDRLDLAKMGLLISNAESEQAELLETRQRLIASLETAQAVEGVEKQTKPHLNKLETLFDKAKALPPEEFQQLLAALIAQSKGQSNDAGTAVTSATSPSDGNSAAESSGVATSDGNNGGIPTDESVPFDIGTVFDGTGTI